MELVNPLSAFQWDAPLNVNGIAMRGVAEKQGYSFSRAGYLAACDDPTIDPDALGRALRRQLRPLSATTLARARDEYAARTVTPFPRYFIIEPMALCNRRCPFCPISVVERFDEDGNRAGGRLAWADFTKLMDECGGQDVYGLSLYQLGESFLWRETAEWNEYPESRTAYTAKLGIADMVNYAKRKGGFRAVNLSTNGDVPNLASVLGSELDDLIISIDGTTAEVYDANRPSTTPHDTHAFTRTVQRVRDFLATKAARGEPRPFVRLQIINKDNTAGQVLDFIREWIDVPGVDDVFVKNLDSMAPWLGGSVVSAEESAAKMAKVMQMPCQHLWAVGSMTASGQLNGCCHDAKSELAERGPNGKFATIRNTTFAAWWSGAFMTKLRGEHVAGQFRKPCATCAERDPWLGTVRQ